MDNENPNKEVIIHLVIPILISALIGTIGILIILNFIYSEIISIVFAIIWCSLSAKYIDNRYK